MRHLVASHNCPPLSIWITGMKVVVLSSIVVWMVICRPYVLLHNIIGASSCFKPVRVWTKINLPTANDRSHWLQITCSRTRSQTGTSGTRLRSSPTWGSSKCGVTSTTRRAFAWVRFWSLWFADYITQMFVSLPEGVWVGWVQAGF